MDALELMRVRVETLYVFDAAGRMLTTNEPSIAARRPAPRVFVGRTLEGDVARFDRTVPNSLVRDLGEIVSAVPPLDAIRPNEIPTLARALTHHWPDSLRVDGVAYRFPESVAVPDGVVQLRRDNVHLARDTFPWLVEEIDAWQPCFSVVQDGAAVCICFSSRIGARACEAGIETLAEFRGRGYASSATAGWATCVRTSGRIALYSTTWDNVASRAVARRVGLSAFGTSTTWASVPGGCAR